MKRKLKNSENVFNMDMEYVDLTDLTQTELKKVFEHHESDVEYYAKDKLDRFTADEFNFSDFSLKDMVDYIKQQGVLVVDNLYYPNNSINHKSAFERLFRNTSKIPLRDLEKLLDDNNCL